MEISKNLIDFELLRLRHYSLERLTRNKEKAVYGLDTETLNGSCRLIADNTGQFYLGQDVDKILAFLTLEKFRSSHNFFFNLNYDINGIIKYLPRENLNELYHIGKTKYSDSQMFFIPRKIFKITRHKHVYKFFDVMQYYNTSLEKASRKYLGLEKYIEKIDRKILGTSKNYWLWHRPEIIRYCINDAILTKKLGDLLYKNIVDKINLHPNNFISKAGLCKDYVRKTVNIPDINKLPNNALRYAFNSYSGGRFEVLKKGNVGDCTLFDITSAYPYHIRNLLDVNAGKWFRVKSLHEHADYGFYLVQAVIKFNKISPISLMLKNGTLIYPIADMTLYLTKDELLNYEKYIDYEIIDGWEFYADKKIYPFRDYIDKLFALKSQASKSSYEYDLYKILMNSLYGCFYEKQLRPDGYVYAGKLFNPIYASILTANTRIAVFTTAMPYINDTVGFATDSILFNGQPDIKTEKGVLGSWELQTKGRSIVLRSGIYQIADILKNRGLKKAETVMTPYGVFKNVFTYIQAKPTRRIYPVIMNRPLTFIEVLLHNKQHDLKDINRFVDLNYNLDINKDCKRIWDYDFNAGKDIFESQIDSQPLIL